MPLSPPVVAVLHQELPPPSHNGIVKAPKPGGYRDSGADIAFALRQAGVSVVTPERWPDPGIDTGWTFPDSTEGIAAAVASGATTLWANTVLFSGHPIERALGRVDIVGQMPATVQHYDDKAVTNRELREAGLPAVRHVVVASAPREGELSLADLDDAALGGCRLVYPLVVKPVRGRGSAGVTVVEDAAALRDTVTSTIASGRFGRALMVEPCLPGEEVTISVMPGSRSRPATVGFWCLPPVRRFNHHRGVAPYNGTVAVVRNSEALQAGAREEPAMRELLDACRRVAEHIGARAPIRIDSRQDATGTWRIFDVNLKPNLTGPGRPGRDDQLSLTGMAAAAAGMTYPELVLAMLDGAWR